MPRPKGYVPSPETRAKISASLKARPDTRERALKALELAWKSPLFGTGRKPRTRPPTGTPESALFEKIRKALGSAAAHAELRRGV